ncbi:MAG: cytoskeleton protein RodZ [Betaproteobacteria bacterium]|jgi:cytoskeleton protein RodZ|nr:cytoskeleton protein RodZ [Betaproteobacteria bacterium]
MTEAVISGVGAELSRIREERGLALTDIAQQLKFAARQLEALEQERFDLLPGGTFVRGMVRAYARLLKVEAEPLLGRLAQRFDVPDTNSLAARYKQPVPFSDGTRRSTFVYLGASLGVLVAVGAIAYQWYREHNARTIPVASAPKVTPAARPVVLPAEPVAVSKTPEKVAAVKEKEKAAPLAQEKTVKETVVSLRPVMAGVHRIVMRCDEEAWLEVKDAAGRQLLSSLNPAGCERVVQGRGPFEVVIGNASHVRVLHNDRPLDLQPHTKQDIARFTIP